MAEPMTLREAVDVIDCDDPDPAQRRRARAIVDAAVEAHEAVCALESNNEDANLLFARWLAHEKLRALERGEEV